MSGPLRQVEELSEEGLFDGEEVVQYTADNGNGCSWRDVYKWDATRKKWKFQRPAGRNE